MKQSGTPPKHTMGIYLHIPFCVQKCNYCDFLSFPVKESFSLYQDYVNALCNEIYAYRYLGKWYEVATIYFGGGTPSLLSVLQLEQLLNAIYKVFPVSKQPEITVECNPGTTDEKKLEGYYSLGVNRLSLGLQTVSNERLRMLGRIHTYEQFLEQYQAAREVGFHNISVDLISALPGQSLAEYETDLKAVIALQPEHISSYGLIMEEGTPFYEDKRIWEKLPKEEIAVAMYERTGELLKEAGYEQYEISNYCKPGKYSRHNSLYWTGVPYLGVGLGAASYLKEQQGFLGSSKGNDKEEVRFHNTKNMGCYLEQYHNKEGLLTNMEEVAAYQYIKEYWQELEVLSRKDRMEEFVFLGLRRIEGISLTEFERQFGVVFHDIFQVPIRKHQSFGNLRFYEKGGESYMALTHSGILISNQVFVDFML